jgi:hypothetical protein
LIPVLQSMFNICCGDMNTLKSTTMDKMIMLVLKSFCFSTKRFEAHVWCSFLLSMIDWLMVCSVLVLACLTDIHTFFSSLKRNLGYKGKTMYSIYIFFSFVACHQCSAASIKLPLFTVANLSAFYKTSLPTTY